MDRNNFGNTETAEAEMVLENGNNKSFDLMRDYAKQLNGELEEPGNTNDSED
jgi:hypothetical protein